MCLAVPGKILSIQGEDLARTARVSFGGIVKEVSLAYVPEAKVGDYAIVHVGFAISLVDEQEALRTFEYLKQMDELSELEVGAGGSMKYVEEYRDAAAARQYAASIARIVTRPWTIMEICGGQTHAIVKYGIDELLPEQITLAHGPGCPVCVTPVELIDKALRIAAQPKVIFCSFGDMLRVPGSCAHESKRAPQSRLAAICSASKPPAAMCALSIRRWTRCRSPNRIPTSRWSSSPSVSRRPRPPTPCRSITPSSAA